VRIATGGGAGGGKGGPRLRKRFWWNRPIRKTCSLGTKVSQNVVAGTERSQYATGKPVKVFERGIVVPPKNGKGCIQRGVIEKGAIQWGGGKIWTEK